MSTANPDFPRPVKINGRNYFFEDEAATYIEGHVNARRPDVSGITRASQINAVPTTDAPERRRLITAREFRDRLGGISAVTLWRRLRENSVVARQPLADTAAHAGV